MGARLYMVSGRFRVEKYEVDPGPLGITVAR